MTTENANDSILSTSAGKLLSVVLTIDYRNQSEMQTIALPATLGSSQDADVSLLDPWISRIHCSLDEIGGTVVVRDLFSKNGIFVNGLRVEESFLQPGDRFTLGVTEIMIARRGAASEVVAEATTIPSQSSVPDTRNLSDAMLSLQENRRSKNTMPQSNSGMKRRIGDEQPSL
jgi:pSer/pThr/pTyr-binding forkhead associated (FHA) protein